MGRKRRRKNNREAMKPQKPKETEYKNKGVNTKKEPTTITGRAAAGVGGVTKGKWSNDDYGMYSHYGAHCNHEMTVVDVQGVNVHGTSSYGVSSRRTKVDECPDFGLYLDSIWKPWWRNEMVEWADYGLPRHLGIAMEQISDAYDRAISGEKVEVSCIGGHGRTGTALAVMCVLGGMGHKEAVSHIRKTYCVKAIETEDQEWYVQWCWAKHNGETPEPLPERKVTPRVTTVSSHRGSTPPIPPAAVNGYSVQTCAKPAHWDYWVAGEEKCPYKGEGCAFWHSDVHSFETDPIWTPHSTAPGPNVTSWAGASRRNVRGYYVPMDTGLKHQMSATKGCKCDTCRYLESGHGAFLQPIAANLSNDFFAEIKVLERKLAERRLAEGPRVKTPELPVGGDHKFVLFADKDKISTLRVSENFKPMPPTDLAGTPNEVRGEYVFKSGRGWIWDPMGNITPRIHKDL